MKSVIAASAAAALLAAAGAAQAAQVQVTIGPELQRLSQAYGQREIEDLRKDLADTVSRALDKADPGVPQQAALVLETATPNRPTFNELSAYPGLSLTSVGLGGAVITGTVTGADGVARPISYRWYETDLHQEIGVVTWTDADRAFDFLASDLARGEAPSFGPYRPNLAANAAFDVLHRAR